MRGAVIFCGKEMEKIGAKMQTSESGEMDASNVINCTETTGGSCQAMQILSVKEREKKRKKNSVPR
mgnify:CR=1 FL=1